MIYTLKTELKNNWLLYTGVYFLSFGVSYFIGYIIKSKL